MARRGRRPGHPSAEELAALELSTRAVHGASPGLEAVLRGQLVTPPLSPPLVMSSVYAVPSLTAVDALYEDGAEGFVYSRMQHPTAMLLEQALASLEEAEAAVVAASGTGACLAATLAICRQGDHILAAEDIYGGTRQLFAELSRLGISTSYCPLDNSARLRAELRSNTRLLWVETLSNPLVRVADLEAAAALSRAAGIRLVVDNTFASPILCRPLSWGADLVVHSGTKYLGGHSDVIAGAVAGSAELIGEVRSRMTSLGPTLGAMEAWLVLRGVQTLALRMERCSRNAEALAPWLAEHPAVRAVAYTGWKADPQHGRARRVLPDGCGGMLAFELHGGRPAVEAMLAELRLIRFAPSLADVATTVSHPATTSHRSLTEEQRAALGVTDGLVRLSVGIEAVDDLKRDMELGLAAAELAAHAGEGGVEA